LSCYAYGVSYCVMSATVNTTLVMARYGVTLRHVNIRDNPRALFNGGDKRYRSTITGNSIATR